jgi:hypothetical protein
MGYKKAGNKPTIMLVVVCAASIRIATLLIVAILASVSNKLLRIIYITVL